jgi:hypothetical protein
MQCKDQPPITAKHNMSVLLTLVPAQVCGVVLKCACHVSNEATNFTCKANSRGDPWTD